jgi:hypothetical protein
MWDAARSPTQAIFGRSIDNVATWDIGKATWECFNVVRERRDHDAEAPSGRRAPTFAFNG